jgi:WD40 repeat protein
MGHPTWRWAVLSVLAASVFVMGGADEPVGGGCGPGGGTTTVTDREGGANPHQQQPGSNPNGGADLSGAADDWITAGESTLRESAVSPDGTYFLALSNRRLVYWELDAPALEATCAAAAGFLGGELAHSSEYVPEVMEPARLVFSSDSKRFFVTSTGCGRVWAVNADTLEVAWRYEAILPAGLLYLSPGDQRLVIATGTTLTLLDAASGERVAKRTLAPIVDVTFTPDGARILVATQETWKDGQPSATIHDVQASNGQSISFSVPNCASKVVVTPDGRKAFMAPTRCGFATTVVSGNDVTWGQGWDPVSVLDLVHDVWVRNLPGFGPVALTEDGRLGVAFIDTQHLDLALFDDPGQAPSEWGTRYHIMLFDPETYALETLPVGDVLPRYALLPNGYIALIDGDRHTTCTTWDGTPFDCGNDAFDNRTRLFNIGARSIEELDGPFVALNQFAVTHDSRLVFLVQDNALYVIRVPDRLVRAVRVDYSVNSLNISPDGRRLMLLDEEDRLRIFDSTTGSTLYTVLPPDQE